MPHPFTPAARTSPSRTTAASGPSSSWGRVRGSYVCPRLSRSATVLRLPARASPLALRCHQRACGAVQQADSLQLPPARPQALGGNQPRAPSARANRGHPRREGVAVDIARAGLRGRKRVHRGREDHQVLHRHRGLDGVGEDLSARSFRLFDWMDNANA